MDLCRIINKMSNLQLAEVPVDGWLDFNFTIIYSED